MRNRKIIVIISFIILLIIFNIGCIEESNNERQSSNIDNNQNSDNDINDDNADNNGNDGMDAGKDTDGDGVIDSEDTFPEDPKEWKDSDGDGYGDNSDEFPANSEEWEDSDGDGIGDNSDEYPEDPYSLYNGSDVWELNDNIILARQDLKGSFEFVNIQNEIDYLVWNITSEQEIDILIIDPMFNHVYHDVGTDHIGTYEVQVAGTWEIQLVYNKMLPAWTTVNGVAYQRI